MKEIFRYTDYRKFLNDLYLNRKKSNSAFSYRYIAQKAGLASPSFIGKIFSGETNISQQTLMRLVDVFQLAGPESEYFELMVNYDRAKTELDKSHYFHRMKALRHRHGHCEESESASLYSAWYVPPILTLIELGLYHGDYGALGRILTPPIQPHEVRSAVEILMLGGLIQKDEQGNLFALARASSLGPISEAPPTSALDGAVEDELGTLLANLPFTTPDAIKFRIWDLRNELLSLLKQAHGL